MSECYEIMDKTIVVRVPNSLYRMLKEHTNPHNSVSDTVRDAIKFYLLVKNSWIVICPAPTTLIAL